MMLNDISKEYAAGALSIMRSRQDQAQQQNHDRENVPKPRYLEDGGESSNTLFHNCQSLNNDATMLLMANLSRSDILHTCSVVEGVVGATLLIGKRTSQYKIKRLPFMLQSWLNDDDSW